MGEYGVFERMIGAVVGSYRLEQLIGQDELGPIFQGRNAASSTNYRIRLLPTRNSGGAQGSDAYLAQLHEFAGQVAALRHPYVLPFLDFGMFRGMPYLVWPMIVMRPLGARLGQHGPLDVVTVGRYVDQVAAALESAHEHGLIHGSLAADRIYIQLDGHLVVADFGVRHLFERTATEAQAQAIIGASDACAPEQVLGRPTGPYTDVYALGALTYRMLTGYPVFDGNTREDVAQQHVYVQPPALVARRVGLPAGLDSVIAGALAKNPDQRFQRAGAFANSYHEVVDPASATRLPFVANPMADMAVPRRSSPTAPPGGFERAPAPSSSARSAGSRSRVPNSASLSEDDMPVAAGARRATAGPPLAASTGRATSGPARSTPPPARGADSDTPRRAAPLRIAATVGLLLTIVAGGLYILVSGRLGPNAPAGPAASGSVVFLDSPDGLPGETNAVTVTARGLPVPTSGYAYRAWLVDTGDEHVLALGTLSLSGDAYTVTGPGNGSKVNLLGAGNKVTVTLEQGNDSLPVGKIVLSATFPAQAFVHIQHLLVTYPSTPGNVGLLVGGLTQTQNLDTQAAALQNAAASKNTTAVKCAALSLIDIAEGKHGAHYAALGPDCAEQGITVAGDGFGLLDAPQADAGSSEADMGYLDVAAEHASVAAQQPDATDSIRLHAGHVTTALANVKGWVTTIDADAVKLLANPSDGTLTAEIAHLCDVAYHGIPDSADGTPLPTAEHAGMLTAYDHAQFMATLTLSAPRQ